MRFLFRFFILVFACSFVFARPPLESYKRYMIVMVHGIGANTMIPHDYNANSNEYENDDAPRKSAIWDISQDDMESGNWFGDIGGTLQKRGFLGHTVWYDFYEPWQSPVYDESKYSITLSRYLGDRTIKEKESDYNPMGINHPETRWKVTKNQVEKTFNTWDKARSYCDDVVGTDSDGYEIIELDQDCFTSIESYLEDNYFGQTAQSYWLRDFFPVTFRDMNEDTVKYKNHHGSFLELAQKDWKLWNRLRHIQDGKADASEVPKKFILIGHSMGGLTTRDYVSGKFYKGDVDKLITLDSPHEGSAIANYVQYWHHANTGTVTLPGLLPFLDTSVDLPYFLSIASMIAIPDLTIPMGSLLSDFTADYSKNERETGKPYTKRGIEVMALKDDGFVSKLDQSNTNDFLKKFNQRSALNDEFNNQYELPFFRVVSTSGVPTPGGYGQHKTISNPGAGSADMLKKGIIPHAFLGENELIAPADAIFLRLLTANVLGSLWNDWGSGFVPTWSGQGKNVALFNHPEASTVRTNVAYDHSPDNSLLLWTTIIADFAATEALIGFLSPFESNTLKLIRWTQYIPTVVVPLLALKNTDILNYVGFHGAMVAKVDQAPIVATDNRGAGRKMIDELLWEPPSVSFVYNPVSVWDYSLGGYVGFGSWKELVSFSNTVSGEVPVKWAGESSPHVFELDFTGIVLEEGSESEELIRQRTVYIAGKTAGTQIQNIVLKSEEETININMNTCENVTGFRKIGSAWEALQDNAGLLKCDTELPQTTKGSYTLFLNAFHAKGKGALLVNIGREPGKAFVSGELLRAKNTDWEQHITFKNRRPQKKNNVAIPTDVDLDKDVAEMVDYHRSPLLVVNTLPRFFELEIDELQPDRMNQLRFNFNFGTASITFEAINDPNRFNQVPDGFTDQPEGFVDPSKEDYKVSLKLGAETKEVIVKNPVDAWGKMTLDLDELEKLFEMETGTLQPFLEGRNHLRIYSENRWLMNRVQDMNLFIPGPPPTITPLFPMADEAFCGNSYLEFETDLIYNQSSDLVENDIHVSYSDENGNLNVIGGFTISKISGSSTKYHVKSKNKIQWTQNTEIGIQIKVTPRINGTPANPIHYQFMVKQDCLVPILAFAEEQEKYNPSSILFNVYDLEKTKGEPKPVQDLLVELQKADGTPVSLLFAENFSAAGAKVKNPVWKGLENNPLYPEGEYKVIIRAHDNTIKDNASDLSRKEFWNTYNNQGLPDMNHPFASYCAGTNCPVQWGKAEAEIILDFSAPQIESIRYIPAQNAENIVVYAGSATEENLSLHLVAMDDFASKEHPLAAALEMYPADQNGILLENRSPYYQEMYLQEETVGTFNATIISVQDALTRSLTGGARVFEEGIYQAKVIVIDAAQNKTESPAITVIVDMTAPRIFNANVPYAPLPQTEHLIQFSVDENDDAPSLQSLANIETRAFAKCKSGVSWVYSFRQAVIRESEVYNEYATVIPENLQGECLIVIEAEDSRGNVRRSENKIVVDLMPPEITSPVTGEDVFGRIAIHGAADDPALHSGGGFAWYSLSFAPIDENGEVVGLWKTTGISVPDAAVCVNEPSRGCKPVSRSGKSDILGYWDTNLLTAEERNRVYRLKMITTDNFTALSDFVDIFVPEKETILPTIVLNPLPSEFDFFGENEYALNWTVDAPFSNTAYQTRLEISRLNSKQEKIATVVNRLFEGVIPKMFYGEPSAPFERGVYVWLNEDEQITGETKYRVRLVAGALETKFQLAFSGTAGASLNILTSDGINVPAGSVVIDNTLDSFGKSAALVRTVSAGNFEEFILTSNSKSGIHWVLNANYLSFEGSFYQNQSLIPLYASDVSGEYAFIGSEKQGIGSGTGSSSVLLPSFANGRNFIWNGTSDGTGANVPSGTYKIKTTLEGLQDNQTAVAEKIVTVIGAPVNITEAAAIPSQVNFSQELPQATLSFKIDQDALISVFVRAKDGDSPTDLKETMLLFADGQKLKLEKQLLAGRSVPYTINWNGIYGNNRLLTPNGNGYEFVIQAYDLTGNTLQKEVTAPFEVFAQGMTEDGSNVLLFVDGNNSKKITHGGVSYQVAQGLNDLVIQASPAGRRVVKDNVNVTLGYKGTQNLPTLPYERYSIGVQIHKKSINFWAVVAGSFRYNYEDETLGLGCTDETKYSNRVNYTSVSFHENDKTPKRIEMNFISGSNGTDLNDKMDYGNAHVMLIAKYKISETELKAKIKAIEDEDDVGEKQTALTNLKTLADADFLWAPDSNSVMTKTKSLITGIKSGGRIEKNTWIQSQAGTNPRINSTDIFWDLRCDVGTSANKCGDEYSMDIVPGANGKGNGIPDEGEPLHGSTERFNPTKHQAEFSAQAWAWKNTDGENKRWNPTGCVGDDHTRHHLMFIFDLMPSKRFWANPDNPSKENTSDYGWNNLVNRYVTLDPLNTNFLFSEGAPFASNKTPFINPNNPSQEYHLSEALQHREKYFITLLHNGSFQSFVDAGYILFRGILASDVEMRLHFFKIEPSSRKYYPATFKVNVKKDREEKSFSFSYNGESDVKPIISEPILLGGLVAGTPLSISIQMPTGNAVQGIPSVSVPWPLTAGMLSEVRTQQCADVTLCGAKETDVEIDVSGAEIFEESEIQNGYKQFPIIVPMGRLADNTSGYDLSSYAKKTGDYYYTKQGPDNLLVLTENPNVSIKETDRIQTPADYYIDKNQILRKENALEGYPYIASADPLMAKIDDDEDGLIAEDGGSDAFDDDFDLALDEDPADAVRLRVRGVFPFVSGGASPLLLSYSLADSIQAKADRQGVAPGISDNTGWSVLKKTDSRWSDAGDLLTQWESSNQPSAFKRTNLYYKDGKPHTDVLIHSAQGMDDFDASKAVLYLVPAAFDGRDRRVLEIRGELPWKKGDRYQIYASSDAGWIDLTPEIPRTPPKEATRLSGILAYWDVKTSGFHQLMLIRTVGGVKYYKVFPVVIGSENSGNGTFGDALGRAQISTGNDDDFMDVVPLGNTEVPQIIPGDQSMGPVVQIYPAAATLGKNITLRLRYTREEINNQNWTEDASIYVVSEGNSPQRLSAVTWAFYDTNNRWVTSASLGTSNWEYAVISGILSVSGTVDSQTEALQFPVGETNTLNILGEKISVSVEETENNVFTVTLDEGEKL